MISLDGLVQHPRFLDEVLRPRGWREYLRREQIRYIVDYNDSDSTQTYGREWNRDHVFRDLIPLREARVVRRFGPIVVLDVEPWLREDGRTSAEGGVAGEVPIPMSRIGIHR